MDVQVGGKGAPAELLWKRPLALLIYLARSPRRARTREHLVGLLWPEQPPKAAHHSLNEALRILRRSGGAALVASVGDQVRLADGGLELDVEQFDRLFAAKRWAEAGALMAGSFLEGFSVPGSSGIEDWLRVERDVWSRKGVRALLARVDELLDAGQLDEALQQSQRAVYLDPLSDGAARSLIRALALAGQRSEALQAAQSFRDRLAAEIGTKPDAETIALVERVERGRAWGARRPASSEPRRRVPLVGRVRELERLLVCWRTCHTTRRAAVAFVLGDPGTGKTRLADEVLERARLDGAAVATARAAAGDEREAWGGVLALADGGLLEAPGVATAAPEALGAIAARQTSWAERFPNAPRRPDAKLGAAFSDVARAICLEQPLALLIDDAQWLDDDSLRALGSMVRTLARQPCLLLFTASEHPARPEIDELRSRLKRNVPGVAVRLGPMSRDDLLAVGRWALPEFDTVALDRVTRRVATDSAGLPLLAVELYEAVAAGMELNRIGGAWPEPMRTLDQTLPGGFPDAVVGAIRVNFHRLSESARMVLVTLAVLGERVSAKKLARASGLAADALTGALDELEWLRWITADARGYSFVARVVGEIVERDMVTPGQRERIRRAI